MSLGISAAGWVAIGMVATTAVSYQNGQNQKKASEKAYQQAQANADAQAAAADQDMNRANMKSPDTAAMMSSNMLSGKGGQSGTMLSGATGVDPTKLDLKRSTLLGQ